jgi:hypothetical protein
MSDFIPFRTPANTWRGFALRVAVIALAALVVLGVAALFGWSFDSLAPTSKPLHTEPSTPIPHS